jgi:hypothetical protein
VLEVADILRQYGAAYRKQHSLLPHQRRALRDIEHCRTAFFGGHVAQCDHCGHLHYSYHSCRNRHCPKCHGQQSQAWLEDQQTHLLPCLHYLLTFTLPALLRPLAQAHQKIVYGALLRCAAAAVQKLTRDPRWLGATPAILAVLHTWTRAMLYHPHAHLLVSAGGLAADHQRWLTPHNPTFLIPVRALSVIFRAKMREALRAAKLLDQIPSSVWKQPWVVHCQHAGSGDKVLGYLARYVFRVAMANSRLEALQNGQVTFRYRDNRTQQLTRVCIPAQEFLRRFLQHILPQGFPKIRHYGLASASRRQDLQRAHQLLQPKELAAQPSADLHRSPPPTHPLDSTGLAPLCPRCRQGHLLVIETLRPRRKFPP